MPRSKTTIYQDVFAQLIAYFTTTPLEQAQRDCQTVMAIVTSRALLAQAKAAGVGDAAAATASAESPSHTSNVIASRDARDVVTARIRRRRRGRSRGKTQRTPAEKRVRALAERKRRARIKAAKAIATVKRHAKLSNRRHGRADRARGQRESTVHATRAKPKRDRDRRRELIAEYAELREPIAHGAYPDALADHLASDGGDEI